MLLILISWLYIFCICTILGAGGLFLLGKLFSFSPRKKPVPCFMTGVIFSTLYAECWSLFGGVGLFAHLGLPVLTAAVLWNKDCRNALLRSVKNLRALPLWKAVLFLGLLLIIAFFTSRGPEHTDTSYYHAAAIHFLEDYGVIKGLGNLMGNFAYNSSWLPFAALFSFRFLSPLSLHTVNGLLAAVLGLYAMSRLTEWKRHPIHIADLLSGALLLYLVVVACVLQSPATDQPAMLFIFYVLLRFTEETETAPKTTHELICTLGLLSVAAVFTASVKLSAAPLALIALSPAVLLIRRKQWKNILLFLSAGILTLVPFLIRNILLSGYLVYPFAGLDIFPVDWKIPMERVVIDSVQISVYGRALYENDLISLSLREWLPIWWNALENYEKLLLAAVVFSLFGWLLTAFQKWRNGRKQNLHLLTVKAACLACFFFWLFTAPFIRYGLAYLLIIPAIFLGEALLPQKEGLGKLLTGALILTVCTCLFPYWNHYVTDDLLFVKHEMREPFYLLPKDYDRFDVQPAEIGGITFCRPGKDGKCGYYGFPACMTDPSEVELMGTDLKDGIRTRKEKAGGQ